MILRTNIESNFKRKILIFSYIMFFLILSVISAKAYERPAFTDGLTINWHGAKSCLPCHYLLLETEKAKAISGGCKCHNYVPNNARSKYEVDRTRISTVHKEVICIKCHVGNKGNENVSAVDFHRVMSKTSCLNCHNYVNGMYVKPQKNKCSDCHGGGPHVVHGKKMENVCVACHGEFGESYLKNPSEGKIINNIPADIMINKSAVTGTEYLTIGELLSKIIESIIAMTR